MESLKKSNTLLIDQETLVALRFCKEGLLKPIVRLSTHREIADPFPFLLMPSGVENEKLLLNTHKGDKLSLLCNGQICGEIIVDQVFTVDKEQGVCELHGGEGNTLHIQEIYSQRGRYALCGDYIIFDNALVGVDLRAEIQAKKEAIGAKKVAAITIQARPLTRIHERVFRIALDENDLLVIFLLKPSMKELFSFELRKKTLEYLVQNFLPKDRILILPLEESYMLGGSNKIVAEALIAQNTGCDAFFIGASHPHMSTYYENQQMHNVFDYHKEVTIAKRIINQYVYCYGCRTIVFKNTCPHGGNQHINYQADLLRELLKAGLPPPQILMRKEISAILLSHLFPKRLDKLQHIQKSWMEQDGIIKEHTQEDIYKKLMDLYNTPIIY